MLVAGWLRQRARRRRSPPAFGARVGRSRRASSPAGNGPAFGVGAALALAAFTVCFARALARLGVFSGNADDRDDRRRHRGAADRLHLLSGRQRAHRRACSTRAARFAPGLVGERLLTADIWGFGCLGGGTRCGVAINSALLATIVGVAVDAARPRARARRAARRQALRGPAEGDVDPADHHAAVRHRAGARRAVRPHRPRHRLARRGVRHPPLALDLRPAGRRARAAADVLADRIHDPVRRAGAISPALEEAAQTLRASRGRVFRTSPGRCCARRSPTRSCWASSRASPTSAIRSCSPATSTCCRRRSSSPSPARNTIPAAPPCSPSVLLGLTLLAFWLQQRWVGRLSYVTVSGKGDGGAAGAAAAQAVARVLRHRGRVDRVHARLLRRDLRSADSSRTSAAAT